MSVRLAVLVSGGGTTLQNLIDLIAAGRLDATIEIVIASSSKAYALSRAKAAKIPAAITPKGNRPIEGFSVEIFEHCRRAKVDLVLLAGFLHLLHVPDDFLGRVMNIHPSLIPAFCGQGYYGIKVHQAAIDRGVKVSGCTVHFADNAYDHGPIILQRVVPVLDEDSAESLAKRVFEAECEAYPEAVRLFSERRLQIEGRRVRIVEKRP